MPPASETSIRLLPPDAVAKLKSSTSITHLNGVIVELVKNSLDADARTVHVTVDSRRGSCKVEDDGDGIQPAEFEAAGGLGKAHHTSKFHLNGTYGHRGLFLASLASLSLLTVTSRHVHHRSTNSVIFHHSTPVARLVPAPVHHRLDVGDHGTCITVNDLFGNMPVRVKSRALALERPDELEREWDSLRYLLVSLMLANRQLSKLVVFDAARNKKMSIRLDISLLRNALAGSEGELDLKRINSIFAQSGVVNFRDLDSWHTLSASVPGLTIRAVISLLPSLTKRVQFISLGSEPLFSRNSSNVLFNEINHLFALSDFGRTEMTLDDSPAPLSLPDRSDVPSASVKSGTRAVNKWPMFYIRIDASAARDICDDGHENFPEFDKSVQRITDLLSAMIHEFLKQQDLRPRAARRRGKISDRTQQTAAATYQRDTGQSRNSSMHCDHVSATDEAFSNRLKLPSLRRSMPTHPGPSFNSWSRVKVAKEPASNATPQLHDEGPNANKEMAERDSPIPGPSTNNASPVPEVLTSLNSLATTSHEISSLLDTCRDDEDDHPEAESDTPTDNLIPWVDPGTGRQHLINARTGQTIAPKRFVNALRPRSTGFTATSRLGSIHRTQSAPTPTQSLWVENLLKTWDNPVFSRTEKSISSTDLPPPAAGLSSHNCFGKVESLSSSHVAKFRGKLLRKGLQTAEVIAQVDRKFILAKVSAAPSKVSGDGKSEDALVLIDQHAADERCRIEQLFQEFFELGASTGSKYHAGQVRSVEIEPIVFEVSSTEGALFRKYVDVFEHWGVHYEAEIRSGIAFSVSVRSLPILIAERCRLEPDLVIDLIRREIWTREEDGGRPSRPRNLRTKEQFEMEEESSLPMENSRGELECSSNSWVHQLSGCPQSILDLLNSRACRSAIMFNDPLSLEECEALVSRLSRCAFPFQCAHGRPSMIPILDLRSLTQGPECSYLNIEGTAAPDYEDGGADIGFMEAFRSHYTSI